jgi:hypothetical protein
MRVPHILVTAIISAGLAFGVVAQAGEKKHEEESVSSSDVRPR